MEHDRTSRLPPELVALILLHIHDDHTSLSHCALVDHTFLAYTRPLLFSEVAFNLNHPSDREFATAVISGRFPYIKFPRQVTIKAEDSTPSELTLLDDIFFGLPRFTSITTLTLNLHYNWQTYTPPDVVLGTESRLSTFRLDMLRAIRFTGGYFEDLHLVFKVLALTSSVEDLTFVALDISEHSFPFQMKDLPWPLSVCSLSVKHCFAVPLLDGLMLTAVPGPRIFRIHDVDRDDCPSVGRFIKWLGPSLEVLDLRMWSFTATTGYISRKFDFTHNPGLRSVILLHYNMTDLLQLLSIVNVEEVLLILSAPSEPQCLGLLEELPSALEILQSFQKLMVLRFHFMRACSEGDWPWKLRAVFQQSTLKIPVVESIIDEPPSF